MRWCRSSDLNTVFTPPPPTTSVFFGSILCYSQSGNHPQEDLAKFLLQAKYESKKKEKKMTLALLNFNTSFWLHIASNKMAAAHFLLYAN